ncbi:hypothetical protein H9I32_06015 [Bacillus sp. Xin]|uniref:hypothetical protein n=1 Tax=unclassified Bacillus (in: firmicutes) TaxID=185979 RepID=UPI0015727C7E|nr:MULTISPECIES: hypothetical protein [unclassified Bacillus (in: firmicutes)]MBC6971996.1 hypothetical protein [Bacillus sp. Xin]NSW39426.1 hypothetical protein [Bacillus sp. Xin1]
MKNNIRESKKIAISILWTISLLIATLFVFITTKLYPTIDLRISMILFFIIDIGFIIALILGVKTKKTSIVIFSVISNGIFFILLSIFIFLLLIAHGISEPWIPPWLFPARS